MSQPALPVWMRSRHPPMGPSMRELEMTGTLEQWKKKLLEAGVSAEEAEPKLARMKEALERSNRTKDIQTTVQFYKELAELFGDLTYSLQAQNELIALQAEQYRNNGIAPDLVAQWEALKRLRCWLCTRPAATS